MGATRSKYSAVLVGLDGAGKTSILMNLWQPGFSQQEPEIPPTEGYNYRIIESVYNRTKFQFHIFDLAGTVYLRRLWRHFYRNMKPNVILFVVDAADRERLPDAKKELHKLLHEVDLIHSDIIILLNNKKDMLRDRADEPLNESDVRYEMDIPRETSVIEVNAHETSEINRLMHQVCQQLIQVK